MKLQHSTVPDDSSGDNTISPLGRVADFLLFTVTVITVELCSLLRTYTLFLSFIPLSVVQ